MLQKSQVWLVITLSGFETKLKSWSDFTSILLLKIQYDIRLQWNKCICHIQALWIAWIGFLNKEVNWSHVCYMYVVCTLVSKIHDQIQITY